MDTSISLEAVNILQIMYASIAVFGSVLILSKPQFSGLVIVLLSAAGLMVINLFEETGNLNFLLSPSFSLLQGPLFYFFIKQLVYAKPVPARSYLIHLLPGLLSILLHHWPQSTLFLGTISTIIYLTVGIRLVARYHLASHSLDSEAFMCRLYWLTKLVLCYAGFTLIDLIRLNLQPYLSLPVAKNWYFFMQLGYFLLITHLIYRSVLQQQLFQGLEEFERLQLVQNHDKAESALQDTLFQQIDEHVKEHQLFLTPRLSLNDLASSLGLHIKDISGAINSSNETNFCDYINNLRIEHFLELAKNKEHDTTILDMALASGFSSKSSFNTLFKKHTQQTPSQYLKKPYNLQ